jgi:hypothetical protein
MRERTAKPGPLCRDVTEHKGDRRRAGGRGWGRMDRPGVGGSGAGLSASAAGAGSRAPGKIGIESGAVRSTFRVHGRYGPARRARAPATLRPGFDIASGHRNRSRSGRARSRPGQGRLNPPAPFAGLAFVGRRRVGFGESAALFCPFPPRYVSVVIRLFRRSQFVDLLKNSVDPWRNELAIYASGMMCYFAGGSRRFQAKTQISLFL